MYFEFCQIEFHLFVQSSPHFTKSVKYCYKYNSEIRHSGVVTKLAFWGRGITIWFTINAQISCTSPVGII